ncbi:hypothetical protein BUZ56_01995 [Staphylococcus hyicus]|uniref:hypothetical protein n=1 Tax=Staphylococcus hyicus TaxID=1284 RepID=UPI000D1F5C93|nr:hypothetical protein [Staphylococcus hyicus]PTJ70660.1 hypothetical protein BUZ58_09960 [Staphylococcus hyicus]PTJ89502.1 hypothetical protein BUZ56_01995 [Staphylococcus hyicus]
MKLKALLGLFLTSIVLLTGCSLFGEDDDKKAKSESHQKKEQKEKKDKDKTKKAAQSTEENQTDKASPETVATQKYDVNNVTDRAMLEAIIYGNYTEIEKIAAYKSAVANGVIPQGNVMEGPAAKAYESSLRIERGEERSIYEQHTDTTEDVNAEINAATTKDELINALRKKYNGGLSSGELQTKNAIEQGYYDGDDAEAVYKEIQQREADIAAGKYDHYRK